MKKLFISAAIVIVVAAGSFSCKKIIRSIFQGVDADVPAFTVTVPALPYVFPNEVPFGTFSQNFNLDSAVKANTGGVYGANDISSVKVKRINFNLSNSDDLNNISNFESARLLFSSNTKSDTVTIASIVFPDTPSASYTYTPTNSPELKPYLTGSVLTYTAYGKLRKITTKSLGMTVLVTLRVQ